MPSSMFAAHDSILAKVDALNVCLIELETLDSRSDTSERYEWLNDKISRDLMALLKLPAAQHYPLKDLLNLSFSSSSDGCINIYSFYTNNGGTLHIYSNVAQYFMPSGKIVVEPLYGEDYSYPAESLHGANYFNNGHIYSMHTSAGIKYLSHGFTMICSSCDSHEWLLMSIGNKGLAVE